MFFLVMRASPSYSRRVGGAAKGAGHETKCFTISESCVRMYSYHLYMPLHGLDNNFPLIITYTRLASCVRKLKGVATKLLDKRKRQKKKAQPKHEVVDQTQHWQEKLRKILPCQLQLLPTSVIRNPTPQLKKQMPEPVDLTTCETVTYIEKINEVPGLKHTLDGTPVIKRRRRPRRIAPAVLVTVSHVQRLGPQAQAFASSAEVLDS